MQLVVAFLRRYALWLGVVIAAALSLSVWRGIEPLTADGCTYMAGARSLFSGAGYRDLNGAPLTYFPPGYPLTIGLVNLVIPDLITAARVAALLCSALALAPLVFISRRLFGGTVASAVAVLYVFLPVRLKLSTAVLSEPVYFLMVAAAIWLWLKECDSFRWFRALAVGLLVGYAYLSRPEGIVVAILLFVLSLPIQRWWARPQMRSAVVTLVGFGLIAAPWIVHMHSITGRWDFTDKWSSSPNSMIVRSMGQRYEEMFKLDENRDVMDWSAARETPGQMAKRYLKNAKFEAGMVAGMLSPFLFITLVTGVWLELYRGNKVLVGAIPVIVAMSVPLVYMPIFYPEQRLIWPGAMCMLVLAAWQFVERFSPRWPSQKLGRVARFGRYSPFILLMLFFASWNVNTMLNRPSTETERLAHWLAGMAPGNSRILATELQLCFLSGHKCVLLRNNTLERMMRYIRNEQSDTRYFVLRGCDLSIRRGWQDEAEALETSGRLIRVGSWDGPEGGWAVLYRIKQ